MYHAIDFHSKLRKIVVSLSLDENLHIVCQDFIMSLFIICHE